MANEMAEIWSKEVGLCMKYPKIKSWKDELSILLASKKGNLCFDLVMCEW